MTLLVCVADPTALGLGSSGGTAVSAMLSRSSWWMFVIPQQTLVAVACTNRRALTRVTGSAAAGATAVIRKMAGRNRQRTDISSLQLGCVRHALQPARRQPFGY